jgi:hypothetical protein
VEVTFNLSSVFEPGSNTLSDARVLRALLNVLVIANRVYLRDHAVTSLYRSGVVYGRTKIWESIPDVINRNFGDCKSLATWRVAELEKEGYKTTYVFRWAIRKDGGKDFHILVETDRPTSFCTKEPPFYEDPSRRLGMGADEVAKCSFIHIILEY